MTNYILMNTYPILIDNNRLMGYPTNAISLTGSPDKSAPNRFRTVWGLSLVDKGGVRQVSRIQYCIQNILSQQFGIEGHHGEFFQV